MEIHKKNNSFTVEPLKFMFDESDAKMRKSVFLIESGFGISVYGKYDMDGLDKQMSNHETIESVKSNFKGPGKIMGIGNIICYKCSHFSNLLVDKNNKIQFSGFYVPGEEWYKIMMANEDFKEESIQYAHEEWVKWLSLSIKFNPFEGVSSETIYTVSQNTTYFEMEKDDIVMLPNGGYLVYGAMERKFGDSKHRYVYLQHNIILPNGSPIRAIENSAVLRYDKSIFMTVEEDGALIWKVKNNEIELLSEKCEGSKEGTKLFDFTGKNVYANNKTVILHQGKDAL